MAESRRILLTTLSRNVFNFTNKPDSVPKCPPGVLQEKDARSDRPAADTETVRLELSLFEPDEQSFPEFNYCQLIENKMTQADDNIPLSKSEHEEGHIDVCAIARRLEEKYGGQHKKRDRIQDMIDIGYGYDEEDSFIDNSEAYDEFVPSSIVTKFGGFYVNSGVLQFRQAFETEADDFSTEEGTFEPIKKRKLICEQDAPKKKASGELKSTTGQRLRTFSKINEMKIKKKRNSVKTLSVTSMLKKFQREKERQKMERANEMMADVNATTLLLPTEAAGGGGSGLTDPLLSLIGSTNDHTFIQAASTVDFDIDLDSLLEVSECNLSPKSLPQTSTEMQLIQSRTDDQTQLNILSDAESQALNPKTTCLLKPHLEQIQLLPEPSLPLPECSAMPEGLPPGLEESIRSLKTAAKTSEGESKLKFFSPYINSILLDVELQCQELSGQLRSKVYRHLSSFLPCSKDTLVKRVRKLLLTHEEPHSVEDSLQKLKEAIERSMPEQIACFQENCQAYEQLKTSKSTEEENVEEKGGKRGPKKLFKWNQEIRECLGHVLKEKMEKFKNDQGIEEHLKTLLHNEVKPLWPKGWVQFRTLMRESRKLLGRFTSLQVKAKPLNRQFSIGGACKVSFGCTNLHGASATSEGPQGTDHVLIKDSYVTSCVNRDGALDILSKQALAQDYPTTLAQKVVAAAMGKLWNLSDDQSPPFPPPPQSSPVDFPGSSIFQVVLPPLLQVRDVKHVDAGQVQSSPDANIIM